MVENAQNKPNQAQGSPSKAPVAAPQMAPFAGLTANQFADFLREHRKATIYAAVTQGYVAAFPSATPTPKNLKSIQNLAEAVLELMG